MATIPVVRNVVAEDAIGWEAVHLFERTAALVLLVLCLPAMITSALAIWILSRRTPLIAHKRVGRGGSALWMLKFRTMWGSRGERGEWRWVDFIADDRGPELKGAHDPRVRSGVARFLRRHSIDELPQLWHVVRGDMSLVGPRPLTQREFREYYGVYADEVLQVRPGLAGLWQISGRNRLTYEDRRRLDLEYVRGRNLGMYFGILLRTVPEVFRGQNSW